MNKHLDDSIKVVSSGLIDEKIIRNIKMSISLNDYIEYQEHYYDGEDPNVCNWIDIEGMGYGWIWMNHPEHKWYSVLAKWVVKTLNYMINEGDMRYYVYYEDDTKCYHFVDEQGWRQDFIIRLSNKELYF